MALARTALPKVTFPNIPWNKRWIVFAKAFGLLHPQHTEPPCGRSN